MLKRKRKLFTFGLTVFMSVTILCSNIAQASGISSVPDVETESYVAEVSDGESESVLEDIEAEAVESSDSSLEETEEATESSSSEDMPEESCETSSEPEEGEKEVASDIVEESSEETVEEESENSEEISSENAEINDNSESTTEEESTEQNANVEMEENTEDSSEMSTEENSEITTEEGIETEIEDSSELPSEVIEEEIDEEASEEAVLSSEEEVVLPVDDEETSSETIAEETAGDEQTEVFTMPTESIWISENFEVKHSIINYWEGGYQGEVVITNIGDTTIEDWNLMFEMDTDIYQIWNASIDSNENDLYIIKNDNWNANIGAGQSRSFGYLASYENTVVLPESYGISGSEKELAGDSYEITYEVTDMWEDGYVGNITITNLSDTELRNWKLSFDLSDEICDIWNATIHSNENGQYVLHHAEHNAVISAGGSVTIGFRVQDDELQMYPENYAVKVIVHSTMRSDLRDDVIGIAYFEDITEDEICMADDGIIYAQNQLNLVGEEGTIFEQVAELGEEYGFEIVGYIEFTNDYQVKFVNDKTYEELNELIDELEQNELILEANLNLVCFMETNEQTTNYYPPSGLWFKQWGGKMYGYNWGLEAIDAPQAWAYKDQMSTVKIGVIDSVFVPHEDIQYKKIWNYENSDIYGDEIDEHGTNVAGIMAADSTNGKGIVGVAYNKELYSFAYTMTSDRTENISSIIKDKCSLALMIGNDVKVINISMGFDGDLVCAAARGDVEVLNALQVYSDTIEVFLLQLINKGYDFLIVNSAGNANDRCFIRSDSEDSSEYVEVVIENMEKEWLENNGSQIQIGNVFARYNSIYAMADEIRDRVIIVGAYGIDKQDVAYMKRDSQIGERVDIVAPGEYICTTALYEYINGEKYNNILSGTSFAAPFVSGTAALVYSVNPELSGPQVKEIIVDSAIGTIKGISSYENEALKEFGISYMVPQDLTEYKCLNAGAAVEMALQISGKDLETSEKTGFIMGDIGYEEEKYVEEYGLEGIEISAYRYSTDGSNGGNQEYEYITTTDMDGYYSLVVDPGTYRVTIYKEGFVPVIMDEVILKDKKINYLDEVLLVKDEGLFLSKYEITGLVVDAITGEALSDTEVNFREGWNVKDTEKVEETVLTDTEGYYSVTLKEGYYTAEILKEGYCTGYMNIAVHEDMPQQIAVLSPTLGENEVRIVLTWDDYDNTLLTTEIGLHNINIGYSYDPLGIVFPTGELGTIATGNRINHPRYLYGPYVVTIEPVHPLDEYIYYVSVSEDVFNEFKPVFYCNIAVYCGNNAAEEIQVRVGDGTKYRIAFEIENGEVVFCKQ